VDLPLPGKHNVANALAAVAAAGHLGYAREAALAALADFRGIRRRLERVGTVAGVTVIDDFAHNPDKIAASLDAVHASFGRVICVFQPHGYSPLRLFGAELVEAFAAHLQPQDELVLSDVYYAGGTATRDVTPGDIVDRIATRGIRARWIGDRAKIVNAIAAEAKPGDAVAVMGARDPSLTTFAKDILFALENRNGATPA
jgi:UDP-N-acetylmuramate--alanine ligase